MFISVHAPVADFLTGITDAHADVRKHANVEEIQPKIIEIDAKDNFNQVPDTCDKPTLEMKQLKTLDTTDPTRAKLHRTPTFSHTEHFILEARNDFHESSFKSDKIDGMMRYNPATENWTEPALLVHKAQRDTEEALRSDLAAITVKCRRLEEEVRESRAGSSERGVQVAELSRQLDAHRQEHARQAATIISLRSRLQEAEDAMASLQASLHRAELSAAALTRDNRRHAQRIAELEDRLRVQLEEREGAEQRGEASQKRLGELVASLTSLLGIPKASTTTPLLSDAIVSRLTDLLKELGVLRVGKAELEESLQQQAAAAEGARQTVTRLLQQLDDERRSLICVRDEREVLRKSEDELRLRMRGSEEEVVSLRERVHSTSSSLSRTLEDLHATEAKLHQARDECVVVEHRRQQAEVEWKGVLNTIASLLSTSTTTAAEGARVAPAPDDIVQALQTRVATAREMFEANERLKHRAANLEDQVSVQTELYEAACRRAHKAEEDNRTLQARVRTLEADLGASEQAREECATGNEKNGRLLSRVMTALGLEGLENEARFDADLIVCRAQQLAKLEGDKIVDKTTTVYQLQRKVKSLREAVDRKELHLDMLRRKLALNEEATKAAKSVEDEKEDLLVR
ncbi:coiled-coil domain-containing protein 170-like [Hyalella azteca]|uniref:Coiled-coil domain-containing protein 170-like n=1 Tax=Hyalella azteca TaxID=294128 RepID=A0A979FLK0_HYAAZ|nr:coiled-coil domain-containing protein 170-like [Hyalella azteca]